MIHWYSVKPYVIDWFNTVFMSVWNGKPDDLDFKKDRKTNKRYIEKHKGLSMQELIDATLHFQNKVMTGKNLENTYLRPLMIEKYIEDFRSEIDRRMTKYYPLSDSARTDSTINT